MSHTLKRWNFLKHRPLDVKIKLCKNRINALKYDIKKKENMINELEEYIKKFVNDLKELRNEG